MRWIIESSMRFRLLVVAAVAALTGFGFAQLRSMPVDIYPEFTPTQVEVQTEALGLSAEEVEQLITVPLEQDLLVGVPYLDEIESASLPGLSSVLMTFEPGTDLLDARQVVQERLTQAVGVAGLPNVAKPPQMIQPVSANRRVSMIKLSSESLTPIDVSVLARWVISPRLMGVPGVANVTVWGFRDRQLQVLVDPERLQESGTTLAQVIDTAGNALEVSPLSFLEASTPGTGGFIDTTNQRLNIFHELAITTAEELSQVPLEGAAAGDATPATLGDVTTVVEDSQPLIGEAICPSDDRCIFLVVEKFPDANTVEVTDDVDAAIDAMRPGLGDIRIDSTVYRPASFIESSFQNLWWVLLAGGLLLLLVIGAFFWDWRRVLISLAAIAASLGAAAAVLYLRGTTVNLMVVAGLVLGLTAVIQDAIVDPQTIARRARDDRERDSAVSAWTTIVRASTETRRAVLYAVLIAAAAAIPLFFLRGEGGAFLPPIVLSYLLAVAVSMLVALTLTPALSLLQLAKAPLPRSTPPWLGRLRGSYDRIAPRLLIRTGAAVAVAAVIAAIGLAAVPFLETSMRPALKEPDVLVHIEAAPGTSLPRMTEITRQAVEDLGSLPGVVNIGGQVGRAVMSDQIVNVNSGEIWVKVDATADYDRTVAAIADTVRDYPDVSTDVLTYSAERVADILGRSDNDVVVRIYGENEDVLAAKADEVRAMIAGVDGVARANVERPAEEPTVHVEVDLARAQVAGVKPGDVRRTAATLLGGLTVGNLFEQQKVFDVVVWGAPEIRQSETDIEQLLVDTPDGGHVRVGDVATVRVESDPAVIRHESVATYLDVTADVAGRDVSAALGEIDGLIERVEFPLEHHAELLGGFQEQQTDRTRVIGVAVAAVIAIFLLLQGALRSWWLAILSFCTLPLALAGGAVAALLAGGTLTIGSIAGLLAVVSIAARAVVLLIRRYHDLERAEDMTFGPELIIRGTREGLVPTLIAMLATAVVLAPIAFAGNAAGFELVQPMAVVVLGGLVATAVVNVFVVPVLYFRYGFLADRDSWTDDLFAPVSEQRTTRDEASIGILRRIRQAASAMPIIPALLLPGCGGAVADAYTIEHEPARVATPAGSDHHPQVIVEEEAAQRLAIQTTVVEPAPEGVAVPSSAVFVDPDGVWWVYTNPEPLVFERHEIGLEREEGGVAYLSSGPPAGTKVVTVGVPELYGVEEAVGH
jgi:Cu/Ag efflux pump CusA